MKLKKLFIIFCIFISCNNSENKEIKDFENVFSISENEAIKFGLPANNFSISYPDGIIAIKATEESYNPNYIEFAKYNDETFIESLSIGVYESAGLSTDFINESLLAQFQAQYESQLPGIEVVFSGTDIFNGKELYQLKLQFQIVDEMYGFPGKYKMLLVLYPPENGGENGVMLIFQATEDSDIEDFSDFGEKGITGEIWQTFRYNYKY